jgi:hypothetical protein
VPKWIEHSVEPKRLILEWRPPQQVKVRMRWAVGELVRDSSKVWFRYFGEDEIPRQNLRHDLADLKATGFSGYPAFLWKPGQVFEDQAISAFMRRVPSRQRSDFAAYLEQFQVKADSIKSDFQLLAVTGASLPNDGFSLVDPLDSQTDHQDTVLQVYGLQYQNYHLNELKVDDAVILIAEPENEHDRFAVKIESGGRKIGYVPRLQAESICSWLRRGQILGNVLKINGTLDRPRVLIFVAFRATAYA